MTTDQIILFSLFGLVFAMLLWGRFRYDLVAFVALLAGLVLGVVPKEAAFSGFGHPATIIVALVLVVSRGLVVSGAVEMLTGKLIDAGRSLSGHIAVMAGLGGALSAVMNNVAALALLMPVDLNAAAKAERSPGLTLMPLAFATILGGLVTLIGTPPNIIIAQFRDRALGSPYHMFDFAPVGLACAVVGIAFVALVGWRLIPQDKNAGNAVKELFDVKGYISELVVGEKSKPVGMKVSELDDTAIETDTEILGLVRGGHRMAGLARRVEIQAGDTLVVEAKADALDQFASKLKLEFQGEEKHRSAEGGGMNLMEVVVPRDARIAGRSAMSIGLLYRHGVTLLGVSRSGKRFSESLRKLTINPGDVLLLLGPEERLSNVVEWLGVLPLAERDLQITRSDRAWPAIALFAGAVALASFGLLYLPVALAIVVAAYVAFDIVPIRQVYDHIEWPVVVLLGSMIPLGAALETAGGTALIGKGIVSLTEGYGPTVTLTLLMIVTMTLSDVLNNTATTVVAAPIAVDIAGRMDTNADPFLMAVAVAASCAFLTPIGHKNNTLILGPGGYAFGDYWRMGLPLELIVVAVAVPMILLVWPF
ncbi:di/tricarboxylate transporter [Rhodobium orientis]|uniref:SLC13 family permease n=1 Tax=Rhodobium orientis TaxID=34017 RepID=A0A327JPU7_9HYPH|nr:SLC13 family permease [Rhodobium orientis]MBB4304898.1 di/tricarboxylate transporter [Rhodobium orientis]MBK5949227.1 SLC13 family permease [Rhodobium orientis]RAI27393.1 SLC13 family permease [Rhodobium orientis]